MTFSHDVERSLALVVDLVNSAAAAGEELLPDATALRAFVDAHEVSDIGAVTAGDLQAVHELRPQIGRAHV